MKEKKENWEKEELLKRMAQLHAQGLSSKDWIFVSFMLDFICTEIEKAEQRGYAKATSELDKKYNKLCEEKVKEVYELLTKIKPMDRINWKRAKEFNLECPHGNFIGWCDDCPKDYFQYIKSFFEQAFADQKEELAEKVEDIIDNGIEKYGCCSWDNILWHIKQDILKLLNPNNGK